MDIFKNYTFSWWQIGLLKLALFSFGLAIGAFWHEVFSPHITVLIILGIVLAIYIGFVSLEQKSIA